MEINAQLISEVKRINQRYVDVVKTFGEQSELAMTYKRYFDKITTTALTSPVDKNGKPKKQYLQIKTPSKLNEKDIRLIKILNTVHTKGQYKASKQNLYKQLFDKTPTEQELKDFIDELEDMHSFIEENATFIYNVSEDLTKALHRSSNLTTEEFKKMQRLIKIARQTNYDVVETIIRMNKEEQEQYD